MQHEKPIAAVLAELRRMSVSALVERYEEVFGKRPRIRHRDWLWRRIAWKVQEQRFGGLSSLGKRRIAELIAEMDLPFGKEGTVRGRVANGKAGPVVGTVLTRVWKDQEVRATAVEGGWEHDGVVHRSLSALAKAVTGSHMSGPSFFGLAKRRSAS